MIELRANKGPTGRLLREMLVAKGLVDRYGRGGQYNAVVNYGYGGTSNLPTLNARAGTFNKLQELEFLEGKGVSTVPFSRDFRKFNRGLVMGRNIHHTRGTDIVIYRAGEGGPRKDFYTQLIPKRREYRVWAFRRTCIGVYEKVLTYPRKNGRRGRSKEVWNWRNGYAYHFVHPTQAPEPLKALGCAAIDALGLDFGAADIILGNDTRYYVLECNTAPGVEGPRQALMSLVGHIEKWAKGGFKRRNGEERG